MSHQTNNDFEIFCKKQISFLDQDITYKKSRHSNQVNFNREHADEIMDDLRAGGSWMSSEEPTSDHWYSTEQDDLKEIYRCEATVRKWRMVLQEIANHSPQLDLQEMDLNLFPKDVCKLYHLTSFNISGNKLLVLPKEIGDLVNLTKLDLSNNKLTFLPKEIGKLANLTHLNLSNNQLSALPTTITKFSQLISLDISRNKFTLPSIKVGELVNLKDLKV